MVAGVQAACGLVQQHQLRLLGDGPGQHHLLLFAAGELVYIPQAAVFHSNGPQGVLRHIIVNVGGAPFHVGLAAQQHRVEHRGMGQLIFLGYIGDLLCLLASGHLSDRGAVNQDAA